MKFRPLFLITLVFMLTLVIPGQPTHAAVLRPDLTVIQARAAYAGHDDTWYMYYTVKNVGAANAGSFRITLKNPYTGAVLQDFLTSGLPIGTARIYRHTFSYCGFEANILIDRDNRIRESNETNNSRHFYNLC